MTRRPASDVTLAGVLELTLGLSLFTLALATSVSIGPDKGRSLLVVASPAFMALLFIGFLLVKRYVIDPRGMVLADFRPTRPVLLVVNLFVLTLVLSWDVFDAAAAFLGPPLFLAALLSALFLLVGQGRRRFHVYVATALAAAVLVRVLGVNDTSGVIWVALVTGCALLLIGGWMLTNFIRRVGR